MKTIEQLRELLQAKPGDYEFDEIDLDAIIDDYDNADLDFEEMVNSGLTPEEYVLENYDFDLDDINDYNEYIDDNSYEEHLYDMDELDDILYNYSPSELLEMAESDFSIRDNYFYINGKGDLCSLDYVDDAIDNIIGTRTYKEFLMNKYHDELITLTVNMIVDELRTDAK